MEGVFEEGQGNEGVGGDRCAGSGADGQAGTRTVDPRAVWDQVDWT